MFKNLCKITSTCNPHDVLVNEADHWKIELGHLSDVSEGQSGFMTHFSGNHPAFLKWVIPFIKDVEGQREAKMVDLPHSKRI